MSSFPASLSLPPQLKPLNHYLKVATEHETRDPVIAYWCRFHAVQQGLAIDKSSSEAKTVLFMLLDWLEKRKKELHEDEAITTETVAEAHIENYVLKIFQWADSQDRAAIFNKNVVKAFYTSGILADVLTNFDQQQQLSDEFQKIRKYAKWKAAYIHNCLKNGETPIPGPAAGGEDEDAEEVATGGEDEFGGPGPAPPNPQQFYQPPPQQQQPQIPQYPNQGPGPSSYAPPSVPSSYHQPQVPSSSYHQPSTMSSIDLPTPAGPVPLKMQDISKAQKYCKWASSALDFDDVPTAITNLEKALRLLKTGVDEG